MAKKICAIVSLVLVAIVVTTTLILSNIEINNNIEYREPTRIYVQYRSFEKTAVSDTQKAQILKLLNDANDKNLLTSLFDGTKDEKPQLITERTTAKTIPTASDFYVIFYYENPQKLAEEDYTYRQLVFTVTSVDNKAEVKVYITPSDEMKYSKYYSINTNYNDLYNYLVDNKLNK
ncbi:MAG: hypothetical protein IKM43_00480 [Clostridia bacterium]|nr:hypothetical protein [Clostridia bacterium]